MNHTTRLYCILALCILTAFTGCTAINTFPTIARPGDTVSLMIGGSENVRKNNVSASFTDANGQVWDLQTLGLVRSVFDLRSDAQAYGLHYTDHTARWFSWFYGHEPLQTILVTDLPTGVSPGKGTISISLNNIGDNSSGAGNTFKVNMEIIPGTGKKDLFDHLNAAAGGVQQVDFTKLEAAPYAKVTFPVTSITGSPLIGAASFLIDFNELVVNPNDLNIYVPESTVRGSTLDPGAFGKTQRMVYWHQDGQKLFVDIIAPQGIDPLYLQFFIIHPRGLNGSPAFSIISADVYDTNGSSMSAPPTLTYFP